MGLAAYAGGVLEQREIRRASDKAAYIPIAGASTAPAAYEKLHAALLSRATRLRCAQWMCLSRVLFRLRRVPRTLKKCGAPLAARGLLFLAARSVFKWVEEVSAKLNSAGFLFGLSRSVPISAGERALVADRAKKMGLRRMVVHRAIRFSPKCGGA